MSVERPSSPAPALGAPAPDLRGRILATAERLFRDVGYRKTTVADIAAALRMSPGNVYRVFASKKALNEAVAARALGEIGDELEALVARRDLPADERLRLFLAALHALTAGRLAAERRMHEMVEVAMAESWGVVSQYLRRVEALLERLIAEGMASGAFASRDPAVAARCVHAAMPMFCHPALIAQCVGETRPTLEEMTAFVQRALEAPGAAG